MIPPLPPPARVALRPDSYISALSTHMHKHMNRTLNNQVSESANQYPLPFVSVKVRL